MGPIDRTGGCQCGGVRYVVRSQSPRLWVCHCRQCQRQSGSAFGMSLRVNRDEVAVSGELATWRRPTDSGGFSTAYFCPTCGCRILHVSSRNPAVCAIKAGTLDDVSDLEPEGHVFTDTRQPWVRTPEPSTGGPG